MSDDAELLRQYAEEDSEPAFAALVERHLGLVYHAALRQVGGDAHYAQDVAQAVFTDLARKAPGLARRPVLAGWLYTSTRYAAAQVVRGDRRRRNREHTAHAMNEILAEEGPTAEWELLRPVIDDALFTLGERDREAVLLRFFEGRPFAEVGQRIAASEDAARVRVDRALEKLRVELARRGVTSTVAALGLALAGQTAVAAPAGLAATVTGTALAGAAGGGALAALTFMSMNQLSLGLAAVVVAAGATGFVAQARTNAELRAELQQLQVENQSVASLQAENLRLAKTAAEVEALRADDRDLAQLGTEAAALQTQMAGAAQRAAAAAAAGSAVYEPRSLDHAPRLRKATPPEYPAELSPVGLTGDVLVDFVVDASGKVLHPYIVRSSHREFEAPVLAAVSQWEFDPGQHGGRYVNTHMQVPIGFQLAPGQVKPGEPVPVSPEKKP